MSDVATKPTEWRTEFPVEWTAVQPEEDSAPTAALALVPKQRNASERSGARAAERDRSRSGESNPSLSPERSPSLVITLPEIPTQRTASGAATPARINNVQRFVKKPRTAVLAAEGALALAVAGAGIAVAATAGGSGHTALHGTVTVNPQISAGISDIVATSAASCAGAGDYADLVPRAGVVLVTQAGAPIAYTHLGPGTPVAGGGCQFSWQISDVAKQQIYRVVIARRGMQIFTKQQLGDGFNLQVGR